MRRNDARFTLALLSSLSVLAACESTDKKKEDPNANILLRDENNYRATGKLSIPTVETASATDLDICWENVVSDIQCHDVAPMADVDNMAMLRFLHLSEDDVEVKLASGELVMSQVDGYLDFHTTHSSTC